MKRKRSFGYPYPTLNCPRGLWMTPSINLRRNKVDLHFVDSQFSNFLIQTHTIRYMYVALLILWPDLYSMIRANKGIFIKYLQGPPLRTVKLWLAFIAWETYTKISFSLAIHIIVCLNRRTIFSELFIIFMSILVNQVVHSCTMHS